MTCDRPRAEGRKNARGQWERRREVGGLNGSCDRTGGEEKEKWWQGCNYGIWEPGCHFHSSFSLLLLLPEPLPSFSLSSLQCLLLFSQIRAMESTTHPTYLTVVEAFFFWPRESKKGKKNSTWLVCLIIVLCLFFCNSVDFLIPVILLCVCQFLPSTAKHSQLTFQRTNSLLLFQRKCLLLLFFRGGGEKKLTDIFIVP